MAASMNPAIPSENVSFSAALAEVKLKICSLEMLPTELLLNIMGYLPTFDLLAMREVDSIFCEVIDDTTLLRTIDLHGCYRVTPHTLWVLARLDVVPSIQSFNISNCYWLTASQFSTLNPKMPNLKYLDIRGTDVPMKTLDKILSSAQTLKSLSFSYPVTTSPAPFGEAATKTLSQLVELNMVLQHCCDFTFLSHCESLRAFTLDINHQSYHSANIYRHIPSALNELPLSRINHLDFLSVAKKNFMGYGSCGFTFLSGKKALRTVSSAFTGYRSNSMEWIMGLDLPKILSMEFFSSDDFSISSRFSSLRHLNVSGSCTSVTKRELYAAGKNLSCLRSLNISGCKEVLLMEGDNKLDLSFLEVLVEAKTPLEHLNISGLHLHHPDDDNRLTQLLGQLHGLKTLSLPICCLADNTSSEPLWMTSSRQNSAHNTRSQQETHESTSKRQRLGIRINKHSRCESCMNETTSLVDAKKVDPKGCIYCCSHLARVVNGTRQLQSLELIGRDFKSVLTVDKLSSSLAMNFSHCGPSTFSSVSEDALLCISRLTHLRSLVLAGLPTVLHGHSLVEILKNCKQLRSLSLANLGPSGQCQFLKDLVEALKYADRLEDLRLEHKNIDQMHSLFRAVHQCPSLTRLCVISKNSQVNPNEVLMIFNHCPKLILLFLVCSLPVIGCKKLKKEIKARYSLSRPALLTAISPYPKYQDDLEEIKKKLPSIHLMDFVCYESRVASTPPSWPELEKMIRDEEEESESR